MDVLEEAEGGPAGAHLAACAACAARLAEAKGGLALAHAVDVPEPPPFYWQSFRRQVAGRVESAAGVRAWRGWLLPGFAAAVAVAAVLILGPRPSQGPVPPPARPLPAWSALPPAEEDPGLPVLQALGPELDPGLDCVGLAECLAELSDEESADLVRALRPAVKESL
jgi:hypothetical protein